MINKSPIYQQLNQYLKNLILSGEYRGGEKFLTERAICERFSVSRATANKALSSLVSEGVLEFKKGIGTFVRNRRISHFVDFDKSAEEAGMIPGDELITMERITGDPDWSEDIYHVERLKTADGKPYLIIIQQISAGLCKNFMDHTPGEDIGNYFIETCGINPGRSETVVKSRILEDRESQLLETPPGGASFTIETDTFLKNEKPAWKELRIFKPGCLEFLYLPESENPGKAVSYRLSFS
ncbi:GntR family transcriptional regulator [Spirochaeta isovalerica]|uniref:GntR family transcriptional regulator n=1 Tax=Spirochaeta isovalerica TaxID=150 RepID=A0A841R8U4_9SPIO|nr:GntR family transcriptional regulator [Spirochaeta isovalerica]MBB6480325.1 GntR family transcriptional regulator [Spirochaeta isovalerica]